MWNQGQQQHGSHGSHGGNGHHPSGGPVHNDNSSSYPSIGLREASPMFPFLGSSDRLVDVPEIEMVSPVRAYYLKHPFSKPVIAASPFIPRGVIEHLMRNKKDSALGVKYEPGDAITDMEGAAHTFVTPIMRARIHGDYAYKPGQGHTVLRFPPGKPDGWEKPWQQAREIVISAAIQPDFEDSRIMLNLASLGSAPFEGVDWKLWGEAHSIPSPHAKKQEHQLAEYEYRVRAHLVFHLVGRLPAIYQVQAFTVQQAIAHLEAGNSPKGMFVILQSGTTISLELLWRVYCEMLSNELGALEALCPQGYVYTSDPPAIFARMVDDATLLNRVQISALRHLVHDANPGRIKRMKVFAFNNYADNVAVHGFANALAGTAVKVMTKGELFPSWKKGHYEAPPEGKGALLILHNNSDAFGQNIETEGPNTSMDGAIGFWSSAAGSLQRHSPHLTRRILTREARLRTRIK